LACTESQKNGFPYIYTSNTDGLAPNLLGNIFKKLVEINNDLDLSMLIVEQKVLEVLDISDRVYSIKLGRVAFEG
jgi:branched-chain amino acid transport system ATP-binding protein